MHLWTPGGRHADRLDLLAHLFFLFHLPPFRCSYGPLAGGTLTDKYFGPGQQPGDNARHVKVRAGFAAATARPAGSKQLACARWRMRWVPGACLAPTLPAGRCQRAALPPHPPTRPPTATNAHPPAVAGLPAALPRRALHGGGSQVLRTCAEQGPDPGAAGAGLVQEPLVRALAGGAGAGAGQGAEVVVASACGTGMRPPCLAI